MTDTKILPQFGAILYIERRLYRVRKKDRLEGKGREGEGGGQKIRHEVKTKQKNTIVL